MKLNIAAFVANYRTSKYTNHRYGPPKKSLKFTTVVPWRPFEEVKVLRDLENNCYKKKEQIKMSIKIEVINPFTGELVERDVSGLSQSKLNGYLIYMTSDELYDLEGVGDCPAETLAAFVKIVGPERAGEVIF